MYVYWSNVNSSNKTGNTAGSPGLFCLSQWFSGTCWFGSVGGNTPVKVFVKMFAIIHQRWDVVDRKKTE